MEEKKNVDRSHELNEETMKKVDGGAIYSIGMGLNGNDKNQYRCLYCDRYFGYAPGLYLDPYDPKKYFCSEEHQKEWEKINGKFGKRQR
ncbi:MAG: hypothetical protein IKX89_06835 [Firmicutes bacterium]|nr:hypothetical protein [Bacillota bacterium]